MPSETIKVCVRTRPTAHFAQGQIVIDTEKNEVLVHKRAEAEDSTAAPSNAPTSFKFHFHHVLHNASQDVVYEMLAYEIVQSAIDGINGTIMTYGQTGSGKSFTILGDIDNYMHRGIAPRAIAHIFAEVGSRIETQYDISCSYMEIYNERIYDLLKSAADPKEALACDYTVALDRGGRGVYARGVTEVTVKSDTDALNLLFTGQLARTTAHHKLNRNSNRSHSIFTILIKQQSRSGISERVMTSKLNLVDLAGSERLKKTMDQELEKSSGTSHGLGQSQSDTSKPDETLRKESMYINQSLTYLEQCVVALGRRSMAENRGRLIAGRSVARGDRMLPSEGGIHVAYRQTKLTALLKDALGGNSKTLLFACIWGEAAHLEETVSTLRLASRMMRVQNATTTVEVNDPVRLARKQERTIRELKQELLMHDALADRSGIKYEPYSAEEKDAIAARVRRYADAQDDAANELLLQDGFQSVREMREVCLQFKRLLNDAEAKASQAAALAANVYSSTQNSAICDPQSSEDPPQISAANHGQSHYHDQSHIEHPISPGAANTSFVGELDQRSGFALGRAPDSSRPASTEFPGSRNRATTNAGQPSHASAASTKTPNSNCDNLEVAPRLFADQFSNDENFLADLANVDMPDLAPGGLTDGNTSPGSMDDSRSIYAHFKQSNPGAAQFQKLMTLKSNRTQCLRRVRECAQAVNGAKAEIDNICWAMNDKRNSTKMEADVVDEEFFLLLKSEREAKVRYRAMHAAWLEAKERFEASTRDLTATKEHLKADFQDWTETFQSKERRGMLSSLETKGTLYAEPLEAGDDPDDKLDDQEQFDKLEVERIAAQDPDSTAFFRARKTRKANMAQKRTQLRQIHKAKRR